MKMLRMEEEQELGEKATSECSSGCESGWTMYLDQSYEKEPTLPCTKAGFQEEEEEEEEDLSMVSDASSGPPHLHEDEDSYCFHSYENGSFCPTSSPASAAASLLKKGDKRRRVETGGHHQQQQKQEEDATFLDDTASSPLFAGFSKTSYLTTTSSNRLALEFSHGFSATHYEGKFTLQKRLDFLKPASAAKSQIYRGGGGKKKTW